MRLDKLFRLAIVGVVALMTGCATFELPFFASGRAAELLEEPGRIGVVAVGFHPEANIRLPLREELPRTASGAKEGAKKGVGLACGPFAAAGFIPGVNLVLGAVCVVAVVPLAAVGALAGALGDSPQTRAEPARQELPPNELLPALVARELALPGPGKAIRMAAAQAADYRALAGQQIDSVLEVSVRKISGEAVGDPDFIVLTIEADARLVRCRDNRQFWERSYVQKTEFILPGAREALAGAVTGALVAAYPMIAGRMATDVRSLQATRKP